MSEVNNLKRLDWDKQVIPHVKEIIEARKRRGISRLTLRGLFYILVSKNILGNLHNRYRGLSRKLVEARKRGEIDPYCIVDESRNIIDINDSYYSPEQLIDAHLDVLEFLPKDYKTRYIPKWYGQPHYVEVWVEKKAMAGVLKSILAGYDVRIVPTGGWASFTYERNNLMRLQNKKIKEGKKVHILYLGDYDPSGLRMDEKMIDRYGNEYGIDLKRIAITREQIQKFGLQHLTNPDPEVLSKLRRDSNADIFRRNNGGQLFQIEVDVLRVLDPSILKDLLVSNIEGYFDKKIYNEAMKDPKISPMYIRGLYQQESYATLWKLINNQTSMSEPICQLQVNQLS
ncbi:MAG: hypothetical protein ACJ712_09370 [Nitrososphaeraceae archaeon]